MTYSPDALPLPHRLVCWIDRDHNRATLAAAAYFRKYRPRIGLNFNTSALGERVAVLMHIPHNFMHRLVWVAGAIDVSKSIAYIMRSTEGTLLTLSAYTMELELDIAQVCQESL